MPKRKRTRMIQLTKPPSLGTTEDIVARLRADIKRSAGRDLEETITEEESDRANQ